MSDNWLIGLTQQMPTDSANLEKALSSLPAEELMKLAEDLGYSERSSHLQLLKNELEKTALMPTSFLGRMAGKALASPHAAMGIGGAALGGAAGLVRDPGYDANGQRRSRLASMATGAAVGGAAGLGASYIPTGGGMDVARRLRAGAIGKNSVFNPQIRNSLRTSLLQQGKGIGGSSGAVNIGAGQAAAGKATGNMLGNSASAATGPRITAAGTPAAGHAAEDVGANMRSSMGAGQRYNAGAASMAPAVDPSVAANMRSSTQAGRSYQDAAKNFNGFLPTMKRRVGGFFGISKSASVNLAALKRPPVPGSIQHRLAQSASAMRAKTPPPIPTGARKMFPDPFMQHGMLTG